MVRLDKDIYLVGDFEPNLTVTIEIWDLSDGSSVALDSATCTEIETDEGKYRYEVDFTTKPGSGDNSYGWRMSDSIGLQTVEGEFSWNDDQDYFDGKIYLDTVGGSSGTDFPRGSQGDPVDNLADAMTIAARYSINILHVHNALTLTQDVSGKIFESDHHSVSTITLNNQIITGTIFNSLHLIGNAGGYTFAANDCYITAVTNMDGTFDNCSFSGTCTVVASGNVSADYSSTQSTAGATINLNSDGVFATIRTSGIFVIIGMDTGSDVAITGEVIVYTHSSDVDGSLLLGGVGVLIRQSDTIGTITNLLIPYSVFNETSSDYTTPGSVGHTLTLTAFGGAVWIDTDNGTAGTTFPTGTPTQPVDNITDAKSIADAWGIKEYNIKGAVTLNAAHSGWKMLGSKGANECIITLNNQDVDETLFERLTLTGACNGKINAIDCNMTNMTTLDGYFLNCSLQGSFTLAASAFVGFLGGILAGTTNVTFDMGTATSLILSGYDGSVEIDNLTAGEYFYRTGTGSTQLNATCTGGTVRMGGIGQLIDLSSGISLTNGLIPHTTWESLLSSHTTPSTMGKLLQQLQSLIGGLY